MQYKSKAPKPRKASIYIPSSYSQWAPLSNVPNFCGFWPESFCGSAAIMSHPDLETKLFLFLTRRAWAPAAAAPSRGVCGGQRGSPSQGWGAAGGRGACRYAGGDIAIPAGKGAPSARTLDSSLTGGRDHPMKGSRDQERSPHQGSREVPVHRGCARMDIHIYLFNRSWASSSRALCAGVSDSSLFLWRENVKTSEKGRVGSLHHFT